MAKRFVIGAEVSESAEYLMGKIEFRTYGLPSFKAGLSQAEAEANTLERGLYPHWLEASLLDTKAAKAAHSAWLQGITDAAKLQYKGRKQPSERSEPTLPSHEKAMKRAERVAADSAPTYAARRDLIAKRRAKPEPKAKPAQEASAEQPSA